MGENSYLN